jgi:excisionase family DNA binding protein
MIETKYLTPKEVSAKLNCSVGIILGHIKRGELPAIRLGNGRTRKYYRIDPEALEAFLNKRSTNRPPAQTKNQKPVKNWFPSVT